MRHLLLTNDWHFASKTPVSRTDDYNAELFGLLDQLHRLVVHFKPQALCVAGDLFHDKNRAPWSVVIRLLDWGQRVTEHCPILIIPGNHDLWHDRYESRTETPIGALTSSGVFTDVSYQNYPDGFTLLGSRPCVYGVPWPDGGQTPFPAIPAGVDVVLAHAFASELGGQKYGVPCHRYDDLAKAAPFVRLWHFGHDHTDNGVYTCRNGAKCVNIGALCRGALDQDNLTRQVKVAVATFPDGDGPVEVQQIALRTVPVEQIFDLQLRAKKVQEHQQVEQFVAQLQAGLGGFDVDYRAILAQLPMGAAVRQKVQEYVDRAERIV